MVRDARHVITPKTAAIAAAAVMVMVGATLLAATASEITIKAGATETTQTDGGRSTTTAALQAKYLFVQPNASAPPPVKLGWVKVELSGNEGTLLPVPLSAVNAAGGQDVADYGAFRIAYVPEQDLKTFEATLAARGIRTRVRDEFDRIDTPGASIDVRRGLEPTVSPTQLIYAYPPKTNGLYLVQFVGPARPEWYNALVAMGWSIVRYLPTNAYVIAGPPEVAARTRDLAFVQFFDFYHPFEKASFVTGEGASGTFLFEVPSIAGSKAAIDAISILALADSLRVDSYENDTYVHARIKDADAKSLLSSPLVIGVGTEPVMLLSDERRSLSLTSNITANGSQPTSPTTYAAWLASHCGICTSNMPSSTWRVGMADTGLDGGSLGVHHPDLALREYWGGIFVAPADPSCPSPDCDDRTHGTMVASVIAGNATLGVRDPLGYYYGAGIAPKAGVFSTKIISFANSYTTIGNIYTWAADASSNAVTIQNHSHNDYSGAGAGQYTTESRMYDVATRDTDNDSTNGRAPMLFTVSSGNYEAFFPNVTSHLARAPATAKNVLSMGGTENYRPGQPDCRLNLGDDFRNIMFSSGHGTNMPGYFKPDLVTPASYIVSSRTQFDPTRVRGYYCDENTDGNWKYQMDTGTSFAAPAAAGAAILVKRYLGSLPADVSPAATKAVLIAGAHSIRGGIDHTATPNIPVGPVPSTQQGFGRLSLDSVLTGATPPVLTDESFGRHFTASGQARRSRFSVRDASKPIVVALVWTDAPGTAGAPNPLYNDLDLIILPLATPCTYRQGNYLSVVNQSRGEESVSTPCNQTGTVDHVNNVEYARFFADGFSQFDVKVAGSSITWPGDPGYPTAPNQDFAFVVLNADFVNGNVVTPPQLTAARDSVTPTTIHLSWTEPLNMIVDHYEVKRGSTVANLSTVYPNEHGTIKDDIGLPSGVNTWVYSVTAFGTSVNSISNISIATTIKFNDDPLTAAVTLVLAQHVQQLRQAIDAIRTAAGLTATSWLDGNLLQDIEIKAQHVTQLQSQLDAALAQFNIPSTPYTPLTVDIQAQDITEVRAHVK